MKYSILNNFCKTVPTVDRNGNFNSWVYIVLNKLICSILINKLGYDNCFDHDS